MIIFLFVLPLSREVYVVPFLTIFGNDTDTSLTHLYSSLQQALDHIERVFMKILVRYIEQQ